MGKWSQRILELCNNPSLTIIGVCIGLLGVMLAIIFYFKSKKFKRLRYVVVSKTIISDFEKEVQGVAIIHNGKEQKRISISTIAIWNDGTETITSDDVVQSKPLSILIPKYIDLLDTNIIDMTEDSLGIEIGKSITTDQELYKKLQINFDYLDRNDGVVFQLVHNGTYESEIKVECKIKGGLPTKSLSSFYAPTYRKSYSFVQNKFYGWFQMIFFFVLGMFGLLVAILGPIKQISIYDSLAIRFLASTVLILFGFSGTWVSYKAFTKELPPTKLGRHLNRTQ